jgi:hypothetical protein
MHDLGYGGTQVGMSYSRRDVLGMAGAGAAALWLGGCGPSNGAKPAPGDEWKQFGGTDAHRPHLLRSLEEAALIDGASRWTAFRKIAGPLVLPGIATTAILCLVFSWNDYAFASTFSGPDSQTLPIAASQLVTQTEIDWGQLTAIGTIVVAPMIVVGLVVRRWLVTGLTLGAVTGE